jgi:hypothetical protein
MYNGKRNKIQSALVANFVLAAHRREGWCWCW